MPDVALTKQSIALIDKLRLCPTPIDASTSFDLELRGLGNLDYRTPTTTPSALSDFRIKLEGLLGLSLRSPGASDRPLGEIVANKLITLLSNGKTELATELIDCACCFTDAAQRYEDQEKNKSDEGRLAKILAIVSLQDRENELWRFVRDAAAAAAWDLVDCAQRASFSAESFSFPLLRAAVTFFQAGDNANSQQAYDRALNALGSQEEWGVNRFFAVREDSESFITALSRMNADHVIRLITRATVGSSYGSFWASSSEVTFIPNNSGFNRAHWDACWRVEALLVADAYRRGRIDEAAAAILIKLERFSKLFEERAKEGGPNKPKPLRHCQFVIAHQVISLCHLREFDAAEKLLALVADHPLKLADPATNHFISLYRAESDSKDGKIDDAAKKLKSLPKFSWLARFGPDNAALADFYSEEFRRIELTLQPPSRFDQVSRAKTHEAEAAKDPQSVVTKARLTWNDVKLHLTKLHVEQVGSRSLALTQLAVGVLSAIAETCAAPHGPSTLDKVWRKTLLPYSDKYDSRECRLRGSLDVRLSMTWLALDDVDKARTSLRNAYDSACKMPTRTAEEKNLVRDLLEHIIVGFAFARDGESATKLAETHPECRSFDRAAYLLASFGTPEGVLNSTYVASEAVVAQLESALAEVRGWPTDRLRGDLNVGIGLALLKARHGFVPRWAGGVLEGLVVNLPEAT